MRKFSWVMILIFLIVFNISLVYSMHGTPGYTVERFVISKNVIHREPVGVGETFSADTEKLFCFLEARDIIDDTSVSFVWYFGEKMMAVVDLPLKKGSRWRTYSSKQLAGLTGEWRVELLDAGGNLLETVTFMVE
jgi:hypothetical protein